MPNFLTEEQVLILKQAHRTIKDKKLADRIKAVLSLNAGFSYSFVARILLLDETTLHRYVKQYREKGIDGLLEMNYTGGKSNLTLKQEQELKLYLVGNTKRTAKEIVDDVFKAYGLSYSVIGVTKLLHRLGFVYKKPKIIPGKADRIKQEQFLCLYEEVKNHLNEKDQLYFMDSTHPEHNTKPSYGWILKGKKNDKFVRTNTGRERLNLNGALSLKNKTAVVLEEKTINSRSTIRLLKNLKKRHPVGKIYLVLDNASHHRSKIVGLWLKKHRRFKTLFLPSYSPNLNLIERLWRFFHQRITWNRYFETFTEFRRTTLKFFRGLDRYEPELNSLLADNFQLVPNLNLQT